MKKTPFERGQTYPLGANRFFPHPERRRNKLFTDCRLRRGGCFAASFLPIRVCSHSLGGYRTSPVMNVKRAPF
jgi:hypothetical protein